MRSVLVIGVALVDRPTLADEIERNFRETLGWHVAQAWYRIKPPYQAKFNLVNSALAHFSEHVSNFDYVVSVDDDISMEPNFLARYLDFVERYDFALAQPARTPNSSFHHPIVVRQKNYVARETRFVEIGPLFSMRQDVVPLLTPFETEGNPMGWGYDFVWPVVLAEAGLKMGIVDATPVEHTFRVQGDAFDGGYQKVLGEMRTYLNCHAHLQAKDAYQEVARHAA